MKELDRFLHFLMDNSDDERVNIYKKIKFGFRNYYLSIDIESDNEEKNRLTGIPTGVLFKTTDRIMICVDNRNKCIEIESDINHTENYIIEDETLLSKWNILLEEHINKDIDYRITKFIETSLKKSCKKDLHREYKMKKIFKDNEPL